MHEFDCLQKKKYQPIPAIACVFQTFKTIAVHAHAPHLHNTTTYRGKSEGVLSLRGVEKNPRMHSIMRRACLYA